MKNKILASLVIHRIEFTPVTIAITLSFMVINIQSIEELFSLPAILTFIMVNIATYWGSLYNVYYDYDLDKKNNVKKRLSDAIDKTVPRLLKFYLFSEPIIFLFLGLWISLLIKNYIPLLLLIIGTFFTIAYSREPLRFKRRGVLNSISLFLIIMFLPPLYGYFVMNNGTLVIMDIILILGMAFVEYGLGLYYTTVDYSEDKLDNIITPSVKLGVTKSVVVSLYLIAGGILLYFVGYTNRIDFSYISLTIAILGAFVPFVWIIIYLIKGKNDNQLEKIIKQNESYIPVWVAISAFAVLIANLIHLF